VEHQAANYYISQKKKVIVVPHDSRLLRLPLETGLKPVSVRGRKAILMPHSLEATRLLRNFGYDIPAPILYHYDWAGQTPFESQKTTAALLVANPRAYVLNEMGTGKTLASLFAYDFLKKTKQARKMLVVAPLSTLTVVWAQEVFRRMSHLETCVLHGSRKQRLQLLDTDADIYIINHDGLKVIQSAVVARRDIDVVLIDELAVYRNKQTDRWKSAATAIQGRKFVWGMTGGPVPKEPTDAFGQIKLLTPERIAWSFRAFRDQTMQQVGPFKWVERENALDVVHQAMQPSVRFKRSECIDLPPTTYGERLVPLTAEQSKAYDQMRKDYYIDHPDGEVTAVNAGVQAGKLIQISCGFAFRRDGSMIHLDHAPRITEMLDVISESASKVIVFAPYKPAIKLIEAGLRGNYAYGTVTGDTPQGERNRVFNNFQNGSDLKVLVAHPKVAAHGLTLTAADTILWYAVLPDLEIYDQACARVSRPGQTLHTHILHLVSTPAERKIVQVLEKRGNLQAALLDLFKQDNRVT
jgi:SNF2 family DNA or RNA helicase